MIQIRDPNWRDHQLYIGPFRIGTVAPSDFGHQWRGVIAIDDGRQPCYTGFYSTEDEAKANMLAMVMEMIHA